LQKNKKEYTFAFAFKKQYS